MKTKSEIRNREYSETTDTITETDFVRSREEETEEFVHADAVYPEVSKASFAPI